MRMYDIIAKKRDGYELNREEIEYFVGGYVNDDIPDYQVSALLMAAFLNGMTDAETAVLTEVMAETGDRVDLSRFGKLSVDKHSTGGVGDKTTLIVAPIVAACGGKVAKMSGKGLGHTGGTADKLQSIPNYKTELSMEDFIAQVEDVGISVITQSGEIATADKKLYALRDVTATVQSIPLIASSIMSKKIASGASAIVLDVKVGSGAFMKTLQDAETLAHRMVNIGKMCNRKTVAVITNMDSPLGCAVGNSLEVIEAIEVLKGNVEGDLKEVSLELAAHMISLIFNIPKASARQKAENALKSGEAFAKMKEWVSAQGGDVSFIDNTLLFEKAAVQHQVLSQGQGYISRFDCEKIGQVCTMLGAGRIKKGDAIDYLAGLTINKKIGDYVNKGDVLCTLYSSKQDVISKAEKIYLQLVDIKPEKPQQNPLIYKVIK